MEFPFNVTIRFPGDLEYIPAVRKFASEILQVCSFSPKFSYRSEIIVDEICNNAVNYGCIEEDAEIELTLQVFHDHIEFKIKDQGGTKEHLSRLKDAIKKEDSKKEDQERGLGLEIVRMLSEKVDLQVDKDNLTSVRIVRNREDMPEKEKAAKK